MAREFLENQDIPFLGEHTCIGGIKGLWVEADVHEIDGQRFFERIPARRGRPAFVIPHESLPSESRTSRLVQEKYGYDIKKQGFFRQAEFLKAVFEIFENDDEVLRRSQEETGLDNPMLRSTWKAIRPLTTLAEGMGGGNGSGLCDGILFVVSLGGGTGTGFINPVTRYIRAERSAFPVFVLGVLTEEGMDIQQGADEARRDLGAVISTYDLLTKGRGEGIDGLFLVDNQIMKERFGDDYPAINRAIRQAMRPLLAGRSFPGENPPSLALREQFLEMLQLPPILVPCYHSVQRRRGEEAELVRGALEEGALFWCRPGLADRAYIFSRGLLDSEDLRRAVSERTGLAQERISCWRKLGDGGRSEVLIVLRNPYGSSEDGRTLEQRFRRIITLAMSYMEEYRDEIIHPGMPERTREGLERYFYGEGGLKSQLDEALSRLWRGEKPFFRRELQIFQQAGRRAGEFESQDERIRALVEDILERKLKEAGLT